MRPPNLDAAVAAWVEAFRRVADGRRGARAGYDGTSADEFLAEHGITFDRTRAMYYACEREIRRRAWEAVGQPERRVSYAPDSKVCTQCGATFLRGLDVPREQWARRKTCSTDCQLEAKLAKRFPTEAA